MIAMVLTREPVPMPDGIANRVAGQFPPRVRSAVKAAADVERAFTWREEPLTWQASERLAASLAAANKVLAAFNPGLVVTLGGCAMTCDCGTERPGLHFPGCVSYSLPVVDDVAAQVAAEDGFPLGARQIKHPSFAVTRRHLKAHPLPQQQDRRAS